MSVAKGFRLSDDSTAKLDWNYVTKPDGTKSIIEEVNDVKQDLQDHEDRIDALEQGGGGGGTGLTDALKSALDQLAQKVAYIDDDGQDYYDALHSALYPPAPPATLSSITAVYTSSGTVLDTDTLDSLKSDLVVTAHYADGTTQTVTAYTLSGTLAEGSNTITVSYSGKTTTFTVTCPHTTVTYIASTDAQYINTNFKVGYYDEVAVKMKDDVAGTVDKTYWGCADSSNHRVQMGPYNSNYSARWTGNAIGTTARVTGSIVVLEWQNLSSTAKTFNVKSESGEVISTTYANGNSESYMPDYPIYIFTRNTAGMAGNPSIWKLYEFTVKGQNGDVKLHLLPVTKSGVPCLYDTVSDTYLYNAGTGTFDYA